MGLYEELEELEYEGNHFWLKIHKDWEGKATSAEVLGVTVKAENGKVCLPDKSSRGIDVVTLRLTESYDRKQIECDKTLVKCRLIYIPKTYTQLFLENEHFPNLEKIEVAAGNKKYAADENCRMLLSKNKKILILALAEGAREKAVVPGYVEKIDAHAFQGCACRDIQFENPVVKVEMNSFEDCAWFTSDADYRLIGSCFVANLKAVKTLVIPEYVKRFDVSAFDGHHKTPKVNHLITPVIPSGKAGKSIGNYCSQITVTSRNERISRTVLANYESLESLMVPEDHKCYQTKDGVLFSKDMKKLIYYPVAKEDKEYQIPDGVENIAPQAFAGNRYLSSISMPNTVKNIGTGAFYQCKNLQTVNLPENLKEIPDSCLYQSGGVFEECKRLKSIRIPKEMEYIGRKAFVFSGLQSVEFAENCCLKQISDYAFAETPLQKITLPPSLERLGNGAIRKVSSVTVFEGTSKGLIFSVNAIPAYENEKKNLMEWNAFQILVKRKDLSETFEVYIPQTIRRTEVYHLEMMWNGDSVDFEEYDECFPFISDSGEKLMIAKLRVPEVFKEGKEEEDREENIYFQYIKRASLKIAEELLEDGKEKEFLTFMENGFLSDTSKEKLLKLANKKNMTTISAYILQSQEEDRNGKTKRPGARFSL